MTLRVSREAAWRRIGDETVVLNLKGRRVLGLNVAGGEVWNVLVEAAVRDAGPSGGMSLENPGAGELARFLADLEAEGVVERVPDDGSEHATAGRPVAGAPAVVWREELATAIGQGFSCIKIEGVLRCLGGINT